MFKKNKVGKIGISLAKFIYIKELIDNRWTGKIWALKKFCRSKKCLVKSVLKLQENL